MTFVLSFWEGLVELLLVKIESHLSTLQFG